MSLTCMPHYEDYQISGLRALKKYKSYRAGPLPFRWYHWVDICVA